MIRKATKSTGAEASTALRELWLKLPFWHSHAIIRASLFGRKWSLGLGKRIASLSSVTAYLHGERKTPDLTSSRPVLPATFSFPASYASTAVRLSVPNHVTM